MRDPIRPTKSLQEFERGLRENLLGEQFLINFARSIIVNDHFPNAVQPVGRGVAEVFSSLLAGCGSSKVLKKESQLGCTTES